jgi:hypothetical protein
MPPVALLFTFLAALTDLMFDWCPVAYFSLKIFCFFFVMVAADAADRGSEDNQRMIDRV